MRLMFKRILLLGLIAFHLPTSLAALELQSLPEIDPSNVTLRPIYLENPRFPGLSDAEKDKFLEYTRSLAKQHFDITINFEPIETARIDRYFGPLAKAIPTSRKSLIADFINGNVDWRRMAESIWPHIYHAPDAVKEYVTPHLLVDPPDDSPRMLTVALALTMKERADYWMAAKAADDYLIVGDAPSLPTLPYNEWIYWDYLGETDFPYDMVITNQPVISVEYDAMPPHAALRGGITAGTTSASAQGKYGAFSWASMFPFLSKDAAIKSLRDGHTYERDEAIKLAAALYVHELGHHLFRLGHPWNNTNCIMHPVTLLQFRSWFEKLDHEKCAIGSSISMTPGNIELRKTGQLLD